MFSEFQTQKQEYVYFLSLTNKKHVPVPVNMCFRFPKVQKTWKYTRNRDLSRLELLIKF